MESDITKTIENNTNKLKEGEDELQKFLNENKKDAFDDSFSIDDKELMPIVETIFDDEQIKITNKFFDTTTFKSIVDDDIDLNHRKVTLIPLTTTTVDTTTLLIPTTTLINEITNPQTILTTIDEEIDFTAISHTTTSTLSSTTLKVRSPLNKTNKKKYKNFCRRNV